jgi:hypothetical protein
MSRLGRIVTSGLAAMALAGCTAGSLDLPWPSHRDSYLLQGERRELRLFSDMPPDVQAALMRVHPGLTPADLAGLEAECSERPATRPGQVGAATAAASAGALVVSGLTALVQFAGSEATRAIEEWASSFEAQWSARHIGHFYAGRRDGGTGEVSDMRLHGRCFSLERRVEGTRSVYLLIGKFTPSDDGFALRITPIYLRQLGTKARVGSGGRFVSAMTLTIESVWSDARSTVTATRSTVLTATMDFGEQVLGSAGGGLIPPAAREPMASTWFPFVPVSRNAAGRLVGLGPVNMTATVVETAIARDLAGAAARAAKDAVDRAVQAGVGEIEVRGTGN